MVYNGLDERYVSLYSEEQKMKQPSLSGMTVTPCINRLTKIRMAENSLLSYLFDSFERFHEFVTDYYEITVDEALLSKLTIMDIFQK